MNLPVFFILGGVTATVGLLLILLAKRFSTNDDPKYFVTGCNPLVFVVGLAAWIFQMLLSSLPLHVQMWIYRVFGAAFIIAGVFIANVSDGRSPSRSSNQISAQSAPSLLAAPQPPAPPSLEEADQHIRAASSKWQAGDIQGALQHAESAWQIRNAHLGPQHERTLEVQRMIEAAKKQLGQ